MPAVVLPLTTSRSSRSSLFVVRWLAAICLGFIATSHGVVAQESSLDRVSFRQDIWPILQSKCLQCHSQEQQKGELRLDSADGLAKGGHTGNPLVADPPESSEIFLRLTSEDPNYRMPLDRPPLSPHQIELFRGWLAAGGNWEEPIDGGSPRDSAVGWPMWLEKIVSRIEWLFSYVKPVAIPLIGLLLIIALVERAKRRRRHGKSPQKGDAMSGERRATWSLADARREWYWIGLLLLAFAALVVHHEMEAAAHHRTLRGLRDAIAKAAAQDGPAIKRGEFGGPIPPRPKHVKQLSGVYYRGNDERDPRLYNGGFYRTATMRVSLCGPDKQPLRWGDSVGNGELYVTLEIERARQATPALFTDAIMRTIFMSRQVALVNRPEAADKPVYFEVIEPDARWIGHYPLRVSDNQENSSGIIYVYKGREENGQVDAKFHYGISYDLRFVDGKISPDSEIWMGSLSVPAGMIIPPQDKMVLNEWFDFRPLPEIEGQNTSDPALLGVPEYEK